MGFKEDYNKANELYKINLYNEALVFYNKSVGEEPGFYDGHFCIAKTLVRLHKYEEGISCFKTYFNRIPKNFRPKYTLGFFKIILKEDAEDIAFDFLESIKIERTQEEILDFLKLLLEHNQHKRVFAYLMNLPVDSILPLLEELKINLSPDVCSRFNKANFFERYVKLNNKINILKTSDIVSQTMDESTQQAETEIKRIKHSQEVEEAIPILNKAEEILLHLQDILFQHSEKLLKSHKISESKRNISLLQRTGYNENKIKQISDKAKSQVQNKIKNNTKRVAVLLGMLLLVAVGSFFGYDAYQSSAALKKALSSNDIDEYNKYLREYGDNDSILVLRENKLYQNAINTNRTSDIKKLYTLYPKSKYLKKININVNGQKSLDLHVFGIESENDYLDSDEHYTYYLPNKCVVGYSISRDNELPITKYFTVSNDLTIDQPMYPLKRLVYEDHFKSNKGNWNLFNVSKQDWFRSKSKGIKLENGTLSLYSEFSENSMVYTFANSIKLERNEDFEIIVDYHNNGNNNGTYFFFGASNRAFNYFEFYSNSYNYGHNNWDNPNEKWIQQSEGWQRNHAISSDGDALNRLRINKVENQVSYEINNQPLGYMEIEKWYGHQIGFGINSNSKTQVRNLKIFKYNALPNTNFTKGETYYCWVKELNVRSSGNINSGILKTIKRGEPIEYLGEKGSKVVNATFNGQMRPDNFYKFRLMDGTIGWVHGGGVIGLDSDGKSDNESYNGDGIKKNQHGQKSIQTTAIQSRQEIMVHLDTISKTPPITKNKKTKNKKIEEINRNKDQEEHPYVDDPLTSRPIPEYVSLAMADKSPVYPGCEGNTSVALMVCTREKINSFITDKNKYKSLEKYNRPIGLQKVTVEFHIEKDGSITNIQVITDMDAVRKEVQNIVAALPKMAPAYFREQPVGISYGLSYFINFK